MMWLPFLPIPFPPEVLDKIINGNLNILSLVIADKK